MNRLQKTILFLIVFAVGFIVLVKAITWLLGMLFQLGNPFQGARP